jgi:O-antigen ligase
MVPFLLLLLVSMFLSITVFEGFLIILLVAMILSNLKGEKVFSIKGTLKLPLFMYVLPTLLSTFLYNPKMVLKALEQTVLSLVYFLRIGEREVRKLLRFIPYLFFCAGLILLPVLLYNMLREKLPADRHIKTLWGGPFEVAQFYSMFSVASLILGLLYLKRGKTAPGFLFLAFSLVFFGVVVVTRRRSLLLALVVTLMLVLAVVSRRGLVPGRVSLALVLTAVLSLAAGYVYLSKVDFRFKTLNEVLLGKRPLDERTLNIVGSRRWYLFLDGLDVIREDLRKGNWVHILIGHGVRSGLYLPHPRSGEYFQGYESVLILSETVDRGLVGTLGILGMVLLALWRLLSLPVREEEDLFVLFSFVPFALHALHSVFTVFWDALLPAYLILFKLGELASSSSPSDPSGAGSPS